MLTSRSFELGFIFRFIAVACKTSRPVASVHWCKHRITADVNSLTLQLTNAGLNYIYRTESAIILQFTLKD